MICSPPRDALPTIQLTLLPLKPETVPVFMIVDENLDVVKDSETYHGKWMSQDRN